MIPTYRRLDALRKCLESISASTLPADTVVVVVVNGSDPETEEYLDSRCPKAISLMVIKLARSSPATARNTAIARTRGEIIYNLDDDVTVAPDLFSRAVEIFARHPEIDVVGGPNLTPFSSSLFQQSAGAVLGSFFGSACVRDRYRSSGRLRNADDSSLITCNLAFRRRALPEPENTFCRTLLSNEENVLVGRLARQHRKMLHDPQLVVYHERRATLGGFVGQNLKYGRGRWQNTMLVPGSLSPMFIVPVMFLLYLLSLVVIRSPWWFVLAGVYCFLLLVFSALEAYRLKTIRAFGYLALLFPSCHLSYAVGFLWQMMISVRTAHELDLMADAEPGGSRNE